MCKDGCQFPIRGTSDDKCKRIAEYDVGVTLQVVIEANSKEEAIDVWNKRIY